MNLLLVLLSLTPLTLAASPFDDWHPPTNSDVRGPCPGLNALANHALLPRSGTNLTLPTTIKGLAALNVTTEIATLLTLAALKTSSDPASGAFTLADLGKPGLIEHDGSLSREDYALPGGEKMTLNEAVWADFLSHFGGETDVTYGLAAKARWGRIQASKHSNPKHRYNAADRFNSYAETGVYFQTLMDASKNAVPLDYLKVLFEEERYPYKEGWRPLNSVNGFSMAGVMLQLALHTPEEADEVTYGANSFHASIMQSTL